MGRKKDKHGRVVSPEGDPQNVCLQNFGGGGDDRPRPELARRKMNRQSTFKMGRTIGEQREKLETRNERNAARKQDKKRQARRVFFTIIGFVALAGVLIFLCFFFVGTGEPEPIATPTEEAPMTSEPTIDIIDEDASAGSRITNRMRAYIGQAEQDFRDLGYKPIKAVVPSGSIREVDFYLDGYPGFIKLHIDRGTAVSVEDADRMLRYLTGQGISDFQYIDVRISGKAYWK
ncbi:hypothetical protein IKG05_00705 [Candidatus Saccharibacteria bacterium]|nr:hypothetical protein [Candidatus Saccharibacteria bacterium]